MFIPGIYIKLNLKVKYQKNEPYGGKSQGGIGMNGDTS